MVKLFIFFFLRSATAAAYEISLLHLFFYEFFAVFRVQKQGLSTFFTEFFVEFSHTEEIQAMLHIVFE